MRGLMPKAHVDSAGTSDWHIGSPPYEPMVDAAQARGVDMAGLSARQLCDEDFDLFDLIITMDDQNFSTVTRRAPDKARAEIRRLMDYAPQAGVTHVPDPYYTRDFDEALDLITAGCEGLAAQLQ